MRHKRWGLGEITVNRGSLIGLILEFPETDCKVFKFLFPLALEAVATKLNF